MNSHTGVSTHYDKYDAEMDDHKQQLMNLGSVVIMAYLG